MNISDLSSQVVNNASSQQSNSNQVEENAEVMKEELKTNEEDIEERNEKKAKELNEKGLKEITEKLNETVQPFHEELQFEIHKTTERMMAKLVNIKTHETIKEMPPEEMLDMLGKIKEMVGLILDEKI